MSGTSSSLRGIISRVGALIRPKVTQINGDTIAIRPIVPLTTRWSTAQISVTKTDAQRQLADIVCRKYAVSRPLVQRMIRDGKISVMRAKLVTMPMGETAPVAEPSGIRTWTPRQNMRVETGDLIVFTEVFLPPRKAEFIPAGSETLSAEIVKFMQSLIIYKDERIIVLNKPTGLAVHAGPGNNSRHLEGWLAALQFDEPIAPLFVHRLDKGTSGALLLARNRQTAALLSKQIKETGIGSQVEKVYWAMVRGTPPRDRMSGE